MTREMGGCSSTKFRYGIHDYSLTRAGGFRQLAYPELLYKFTVFYARAGYARRALMNPCTSSKVLGKTRGDGPAELAIERRFGSSSSTSPVWPSERFFCDIHRSFTLEC